MTLKEYPFVYASWRDVPVKEFKARWPNFSPREIACKGTGKCAMNFEAMDKLQALRNLLGRPLILNSAYRSPEHNRNVGGAKGSKHLKAEAFDCRQDNQNPTRYLEAARQVGFLGFGTYPRSNFIHADIGPARSWGKPFPYTKTQLPAETEMQPESVSEDTSAVGALIGGGGTLTGAGAILTSLGDLQPMPQTIAIAGLLVGFVAMVYIFRHRLKKLL